MSPWPSVGQWSMVSDPTVTAIWPPMLFGVGVYEPRRCTRTEWTDLPNRVWSTPIDTRGCSDVELAADWPSSRSAAVSPGSCALGFGDSIEALDDRAKSDRSLNNTAVSDSSVRFSGPEINSHGTPEEPCRESPLSGPSFTTTWRSSDCGGVGGAPCPSGNGITAMSGACLP